MQIDGVSNLRIGVKEAAESGKANESIIKFLSKTINIPQKSILIISGHTNPNKIIEISLTDDYEKNEIILEKVTDIFCCN